MKLQVAILIPLIMTAVSTRTVSQEQGKAGATVDRILAYAGTWKVETESFPTPYSKASREERTLLNDCWKSGAYLACRQIVDGDPKVLIVFTCSGRDNTCTSYQIPPDGTDPHAGKMTIDGDTWTFPWSTTEDGKTVWFRVVNTWSSPTSIQYRQEFSTDHVHWTPMSVGHEVKAG
jgi:hypothetical protein